MGRRILGILAASLLQFGVWAHANDCTQALTTTTLSFGQLRPDFVHSKHYDVDLQSSFAIKNQCSTSFCHLYAWSADLENPSKIETSAEYVAAAYLFDAMQTALKDGDVNFGSHLGALPLQSIESIRRSGLIPQEAWTGVKDFNKQPNIGRLLDAVQLIIARAVNMSKATANPAEQASIQRQASEQLKQVFHSFVGDMPANFEFKGELHTPLTFADKYFPNLKDPVITLRARANDKGATVARATGPNLQMDGGIDELEKVARRLLDEGHPLWLAYFHRGMFVDSKTGVMSVSAFHYPDFAAPEDRDLRASANLWFGSHAVLLVGYELDPETDKVRKWKIVNSWGNKVGDKGIYHMYDDYFRAYAQSITYLDDGKVAIAPHFLLQNGRSFDKP